MASHDCSWPEEGAWRRRTRWRIAVLILILGSLAWLTQYQQLDAMQAVEVLALLVIVVGRFLDRLIEPAPGRRIAAA